jgi:hypothetical protein
MNQESRRSISLISYFETHSLPALARCYPCSFTFYVARPARSIPGFLIEVRSSSVTSVVK